MSKRMPTQKSSIEDFNALLERGRNTFLGSEAVRDMPKIEGAGVTFFDLLGKLSILDGAIKADFKARNIAAVEEANRRNRGQWLGWR